MRPGTLRPGDGRTSIAGARSTKDRGRQVRNNLPIALTSLIGRDVEIVEISALVREHRLVTLTVPEASARRGARSRLPRGRSTTQTPATAHG